MHSSIILYLCDRCLLYICMHMHTCVTGGSQISSHTNIAHMSMVIRIVYLLRILGDTAVDFFPKISFLCCCAVCHFMAHMWMFAAFGWPPALRFLCMTPHDATSFSAFIHMCRKLTILHLRVSGWYFEGLVVEHSSEGGNVAS